MDCLSAIILASCWCLQFLVFVVMYNEYYHDDPLYGMHWGKHVVEDDIRKKPKDQK